MDDISAHRLIITDPNNKSGGLSVVGKKIGSTMYILPSSYWQFLITLDILDIVHIYYVHEYNLHYCCCHCFHNWQ